MSYRWIGKGKPLRFFCATVAAEARTTNIENITSEIENLPICHVEIIIMTSNNRKPGSEMVEKPKRIPIISCVTVEKKTNLLEKLQTILFKAVQYE